MARPVRSPGVPRRTSWLLLAGALGLSCASPTAAQSPWPVSFEVVLGVGDGRTDGEYRPESRGLIGELLLGVRVLPIGSGSGVLAAGLGVQGSGATDDPCPPGLGGECMRRFPEFTVASVLGGWETGGTRFRVASGPGIARAHGDWDTFRLAWVGRLDVALPFAGRIAAVGSLRGILIPSYRGDAFQLVGVGLGIRVR